MSATTAPATACLLSAAQIDALPERRHVHQFNANAVRMTRSIGDVLGLERLGVHVVRLEPGRDSTTFHFHEQDEEFLYVLSGQGRAEIGDAVHAVGPGDFMAFGAGSPAHMLRNDGDEDLVYLMAGERNALDVVHYPRDGRTLFKSHGARRAAHDADLEDV
ncbi:MAG TPA: cupin domain-containing protein [Pseudomonadales bacterium]|nr:cupin domain-containing protein [Pseudomonadales bacterium]